MPESKLAFQWTGIDRFGKRTNGTISAMDMKEAQVELKKRDIEIITLQLKKQVAIPFLKARQKKIKTADILFFTRYLSTLITAGLPILQALDVIGHDQSNPTMQSLVISIRTNIAGGKTLSESFAAYPQYFNDLYCNLIRAGERSGTLEKILKRLEHYIARTENLKKKIKKALIYPAAIVTVAFGVGLILLLFIVPSFQKIFASFGAELPFFTRIVIHLSDFVRAYWWLLVFCGVGFSVWFKRALKNNEAVKNKVDQWSLKMYILGPILTNGIIARYTRTMAITLDAGMPIVESMRAMADLMGNRIYTRAVLKICDQLVSGNQLNVAINETQLFPNMVVQMIAIGEASGSLADMLGKIADHYEEEVNNTVDNLSSLLEPLIMVLLGIIVGGFVVAMYLPIFKIGSLF